MSKVSSQFGSLIQDFMQRNSLTYRAAGLKSEISATYWKEMADGRVPSEDAIERMCSSFSDLDENELRQAAGYSLKPENMDAVTAVEFAMRDNDSIPEEGKRQVLEFVRKIQQKYSKGDV